TRLQQIYVSHKTRNNKSISQKSVNHISQLSPLNSHFFSFPKRMRMILIVFSFKNKIYSIQRFSIVVTTDGRKILFS
ncbi:hypothetical protein BpHYR1_043035, partial [Brachionus plicatilis]